MIKTVKRILLMAGDHCHKVTAGIGISLLYSIFSAMDLFAILYIAFSVDELTVQKIVVTVGILLVGLIGKIVCKYQISKRISGSSYDVFYERRLEAGEQLKKAPMGYYSEKNLGEIQMTLTTDMNALESSAMSVVENILGSLIYAAICTLVLLLFNWKIGLITLAGLVIGMILLNVIQNGAEKAMPMRFHAQEEMTERTLEFVQGNMVMRLFGTGQDGLNRVKEAFGKKQKADIHLENSAIWPINFYKYVFRLASCGVVLIAALLYVQQEMSFPVCVMFLFAAFLALISGILFFATGECTWVIIVTFAIAGLLAEVMRKVFGYKSFKGIALAGGFCAIGFIGSPLPMWLFQESYMKSIEEMGMGAEYVEGLQSMISAGSFIGMLAVAFIGGLLGTLIGHKMLKKHFEKAGII